MNNFEHAIERLNKICNACDELETMAKRDLNELREERKLAKETIKNLEYLKEAHKFAGIEDIQQRVITIANGRRMISCMGVGIEV